MARTTFFGALLTASALTATAAQAETHEVLVLGGSFFPGIIYVDNGDKIRFVNESGTTQYLIGYDDSWTTGPLDASAEVEIVINQGMYQYFVSTTDSEADWSDVHDYYDAHEEYSAPQGRFSFGTPPLG